MGIDILQTVAGTGAGAFSTSLLYPLDLVKVRLEATQGRVTIVNCVKGIVIDEGWAALYRGLTPSLFGASLSWGLYFTLYDNAKTRYSAFNGLAKDEKLTWNWHMLSACEAGVLVTMITNPIWLVKTRLQLQFDKLKKQKVRINKAAVSSGTSLAPLRALSTEALPQPKIHRDYTGPIDCVQRIVMEEGLFSLWKGIVPALWLVSHGVVQFVLYEELKGIFQNRIALEGSGDQKLSGVDFLAMGSLSKVGASVSTYPLQVIKTRLQAPQYLASQYKGFLDCAMKMFRQEGIAGFYKGIVPNVLRVTPASALTFYAYENIIAVSERFQLKSNADAADKQ